MPDITMCKGDGCPHREQCYRAMAAPIPRRQAWFMTSPVKPDGSCEHLWPIRGKETK